MSGQIYQELTDYRLTRRTRLPASATIGNKILEVGDISLGGIKLKTTPSLIHELAIVSGAVHRIQLNINAHEQSISMVLDVRVEYDNPGEGTAGCSFLDMTPEKREILRILIKAYLSGNETDIIMAIEVCKGMERLMARPEMDGLGAEEEVPLPDTRREYAYLFLFVIILIGLITGGTFLIREKSGGTGNGALFADSIIHTAPYSGNYKLLTDFESNFITELMPIALVTSDNISQMYKSPCDCFVIENMIIDGNEYKKGDAILSLVPLDTAVEVKAWFITEQIENMVIGSTVEIGIVGEKHKTTGKVTGIKSASMDSEFIDNSAIVIKADSVIVTIKPDVSIPVNFMKHTVLVNYNFKTDGFYKDQEDKVVAPSADMMELPPTISEDEVEEISIPVSNEPEQVIEEKQEIAPVAPIKNKIERKEASILPPTKVKIEKKEPAPKQRRDEKKIEKKPMQEPEKEPVKRPRQSFND